MAWYLQGMQDACQDILCELRMIININDSNSEAMIVFDNENHYQYQASIHIENENQYQT